jgi:hypothetical protein
MDSELEQPEGVRQNSPQLNPNWTRPGDTAAGNQTRLMEHGRHHESGRRYQLRKCLQAHLQTQKTQHHRQTHLTSR